VAESVGPGCKSSRLRTHAARAGDEDGYGVLTEQGSLDNPLVGTVDGVSSQPAMRWDLIELRKACMIHHETCGRAIPWEGLTKQVRSQRPHLSYWPWRSQSDGSLELEGRWHVSHMGNIRRAAQSHRMAVMLTATVPVVGI
jgi:hypothetical protein